MQIDIKNCVARLNVICPGCKKRVCCCKFTIVEFAQGNKRLRYACDELTFDVKKDMELIRGSGPLGYLRHAGWKFRVAMHPVYAQSENCTCPTDFTPYDFPSGQHTSLVADGCFEMDRIAIEKLDMNNGYVIIQGIGDK